MVSKEIREVLDEALAIGAAHDKESKRHRTATERLMARAAENVYAAHLVEAVSGNGFTPTRGGDVGRTEAKEAAQKGLVLSAKAYALIIGYSEAYVSRLYRLGFGMAAGVLDPNEKATDGPTRWQLISRAVGDSPEVGAVLGKDVAELPTVEALDTAINAALERRAAEREKAASEATWVPSAPSEQIGMLEELAAVIKVGRTLTPKQIDRVREVMDGLRATIEEWVEAQHEGHVPEQRRRERQTAGV